MTKATIGGSMLPIAYSTLPLDCAGHFCSKIVLVEINQFGSEDKNNMYNINILT
jgi:hypothetical protein